MAVLQVHLTYLKRVLDGVGLQFEVNKKSLNLPQVG
jgi:hypothetical protein